MNTHFSLEKHIEEISSNVFIKSGKDTFSFEKFYEAINHFSFFLKKSGVKKGDLILINDISAKSLPSILFSIWLNQAIAFPVNPKFPTKQIENIIKKSRAKFYISEKTIHDETIRIKHIKSTDIYETASDTKSQEILLDLENPATIILTSGSSGEPKYAVHSLANHFSNAQAVNQYFNISIKDNWLLALPVFHVAGLAIILRAFLAGATLSIPAPDESLSHALKSYKPSHISLVPTQLSWLLENEKDIEILKQCKVIFLGGSAIPQSLISKSLKYGLNLFTSYGLTEMSSTVAIKQIKDGHTGGATVLPIHDIKIGDENEILLKGKCLFSGYWANGKIENKLNDKNWFSSKDLGRLDKMNRLTVLGRKDNMFISGGENIFPEEIEKYILQMEGIDQAIVVPVENKTFGFRPIAFINPYSKEIIENIKARLSKKLPSFKIPDVFHPWPKNFKNEFKTIRGHFIKLAANL
ncbi:MAG: o-succinylbenzoate--CoA ligase [Calditrichaeota bacterium]|nr:MAG: o-succinylbenzoate--CoA ligase [Calditrichota bacterium]MBL1205547.1 o-succinylbenzoate--CoA ligase [Calditrichota bacterium]NOG45376.1 o-succinylbenzoate--CoA ligase [Calditrichota bacterium]